MAIPWPEQIWIVRIRAQIVIPGQLVRRGLDSMPHNPNPPEWRFTTTFDLDGDSTLHAFLDSLNGADQVVALPLSGPDTEVFGIESKQLAANGEWSVSSVALGGRYTDVTIVPRSGVARPPDRCVVQIGNATRTRLYRVQESTGNVLHCSPRVEPPQGTTRLFGARTVNVRLDTANNPQWGVRDANITGGYAGTTVNWIETFDE